jgi:hypothetical protein
MRLATSLLLSLACSAGAWAQPRAVLDSDAFDFGAVTPGARVTHRFALSNGGDQPLEILRIQPSCGCTTAVVGRTTLAPGERTQVEVDFDASGFKGPVRKDMDLYTNDPAQPRRSLEIRAMVLADILLDSEQVPILDLAPGDRRRVTVKLESGTGQPIVVTDVGLSPAPWLGVSTRETGKTLYVDLDLLAKRLPKDRLAGRDTVTLSLANPRPSTVTLKVEWAKIPPVVAVPARVAWAEPAGRELAATVAVRNRSRQPFRILAVRTDLPSLQAVNLTPGAAAVHQVRIALAESAGPGALEGKVVLELDVPGQQQLEIRVGAVLR